MTARESIISALCQTMPETAAASGLCSCLDFSPDVARLHALYREEKLAEHFAMAADHPLAGRDFGLTPLCDWLAEKGETVGREVVRQWREEMIVEAMRRNIAKGVKPYVHARVA